ncbi:hypothetical protein ACOJBM_06350 [Rhizobium beringeri]
MNASFASVFPGTLRLDEADIAGIAKDHQSNRGQQNRHQPASPAICGLGDRLDYARLFLEINGHG